jgi:aminoglycoside phosphotransferase
MADVEDVEVVVAHNERATLRVGDVFLKIDADQTRTDVEVEAMAMAPIPTPEVLWRKPPVLALAALPGTALGRLGEPSTASAAAWAAAGAAARMLHDAPLPPWPGQSLDEIASDLDGECEWLVTNGVLPADVVTRNRRVAEAALRPWTPVFTHGDLQITHVFADGDEITGVIDWSGAGQGDALYDLAILTLGHEEHLGDVVAGYGTDVDLDVIRAWWSLRSLLAARWLIEHGFDPSSPGCEFDVLRSSCEAARAARVTDAPSCNVRARRVADQLADDCRASTDGGHQPPRSDRSILRYGAYGHGDRIGSQPYRRILRVRWPRRS